MIIKELTLGIPAYKTDEYIVELLNSVLKQKYIPNTIIILDDDVASKTDEVVGLYRDKFSKIDFRYIKNEKNLGIAGNYNKIVELSKTEWVHICDADDYPMPQYYDQFFNSILKNQDFRLFIGNMRTSSKIFNFIKYFIDLMLVFKFIPRWMPILGSITTRSSIIYKTNDLKTTKFIDPMFDGSDIIHLDTLRKEGKALFCKDAFLFYRIHPAAQSSSKETKSQYYDYIKEQKLILYIIDYFLRKKAFSFLRK